MHFHRFRFGEFAFHSATRQLFRRGQEVCLSAEGIELLHRMLLMWPRASWDEANRELRVVLSLDAIEDVQTTVCPPLAGSLLLPNGRQPLYEGRNLIGRGDECDVILGDAKVSRRHALLTIEPDGATLQDLGSTNGTFVNARRIGSGPVRIGDGTPLCFGDTAVAVVLNISGPALPPPCETQSPLRVSVW